MPTRVKSVAIDARYRKVKANEWLEEMAEPVKAAALRKKRNEKKARGPLLTERELCALVNELEEIQRVLNPLLQKQQELSVRLAAHWGHTEIEEIRTGYGRTLLYTSMSLGINPDVLKTAVSKGEWEAITERTIQIPLLLALAMRKPELKATIQKALVASNVKVAIISPSSRRPRSGEGGEEE